MRPLEALARLKQLLGDAGVPFEEDGRELRGRGEDWRQVWEAFCALAREPADEPFERRGLRLRVADDSDNDLLLHESGASDGQPFWMSVTRQFSFEDERGNYAGMNAVVLELDCERTPEGRVPKAHRWGYAGRLRPDVSDDSHPEMRNWAGWVDAWKQAAEASNSFKVLAEIRPARWRVVQEDI
jgi:hypothetical protein